MTSDDIDVKGNSFSRDETILGSLFKKFPLPSYAWQKKNNDFILIDYNDEAEKFTEGKVKNLKNQNLKETYPKDSDVIQDIYNSYKNQSKFSRNMEYTMVSTGEKKILKTTYSFIAPDIVLVFTEDITELQESMMQLNSEKILMKSLVEGISEGIIAVDSKGKVFAVNPSAEKMFGYTSKEFIGMQIEELIPERLRKVHESHRERFMKKMVSREMGEGKNLTALDKWGKKFPVEVGLNKIDYHKEKSVVAIITDITKRLQAEELLKKAAMTDSLTELYNRRAFNELLSFHENKSAYEKDSYSIIMGDIDHFKSINDNYGHDAGDNVLKSLAKIIQKSIRRNDVAARWGGEEFIILVPETSAEGGVIFAEKFRKEIENTYIETGSDKINVTMSLGVAQKKQGKTAEEVIKEADKNMYTAKQSGRNRVCG